MGLNHRGAPLFGHPPNFYTFLVSVKTLRNRVEVRQLATCLLLSYIMILCSLVAFVKVSSNVTAVDSQHKKAKSSRRKNEYSRPLRFSTEYNDKKCLLPSVFPISLIKFRGYQQAKLVSANWELFHVELSCLRPLPTTNP